MRRLLACLLILTLSVPATACLWDYDTLQMERERFPGALELIVGKFLRHSEPFYEWRIKDRRKAIGAHDLDIVKLTDEQLARTYDDLAAALDKLKRHDEAIAMIREKAERLPDVGRYETQANLGTFLAHSGRLEEGVAELKKAIEINPDAHFGREKYQVALIEYVIEHRGDAEKVTLPLEGSFAWWLLKREGLGDGEGNVTDEKAARAELDRAAKGILGMMRFGDYRSPVLLEALGDVVRSGSGKNYFDGDGSQRIAARAYLRAADLVDDEQASAAYRKQARGALADQLPDRDSGERAVADGQELSLAHLEDQLAREVHEADDWFERTIVYDEELWIERSPDPDAAFWNKYGGQEIRVGHDRMPAAKFAFKGLPFAAIVALGFGLLATIGAVAALIVWRRKRPTGYNNEPTHTV
ncbi:MAG: hypothetical protein WBC44_11880 [Planctomycetaceae bacterium]